MEKHALEIEQVHTQETRSKLTNKDGIHYDYIKPHEQ